MRLASSMFRWCVLHLGSECCYRLAALRLRACLRFRDGAPFVLEREAATALPLPFLRKWRTASSTKNSTTDAITAAGEREARTSSERRMAMRVTSAMASTSIVRRYRGSRRSVLRGLPYPPGRKLLNTIQIPRRGIHTPRRMITAPTAVPAPAAAFGMRTRRNR